MNLIQKLIDNKKKRPKKTAVKYFKGKSLYTLTWEQTFDRIEQVFKSLESLSLQPGDRVALFSETCKEWGFIDMAIMAHRAVTVPLYPSSHPEDIQAILANSEPEVIFIQGESLYEKVKDLPTFKKIKTKIIIEEFEHDATNLLLLKDFISLNKSETSLETMGKQIKSDDCATLIYTSGTSGTPKGVILNHEQIISSTSEVFPLLGITDQDCSLTFLPFSHVLGRMELWGHYFCGYTIGYAQSIDRIKKNLLEIKPTVLVGVPRIFEKIFFGIQAQVEISKLKQNLFQAALTVGEKDTQLKQQKKAPSLLQALSSQLAYQVVFSNIQKRFGGKLRFAVSGGAPLEPSIANFFKSCGISILEGYGLTETTGPIFINTLFENKTGTVGQAIGDVKLQFDEDGEILIRSKKVMQGYFANEKASQESFTSDHYFRTGDIGELDDQGFLKITDRKKDLIKTAGGKFIAPQKLQNLFATEPLISHIHVHGDKKKYVSALITLNRDEVLKIKEERSIATTDYDKIVSSQTIQAEVRKVIAQINSRLASFETIKRFHVLPNDFSIEENELTPSLKMRRKFIDDKYADILDSLYQ